MISRLTGAMAPSKRSLARGLAAMAEEVRPCWAGAKAAADATMEARIIDFIVGYNCCSDLNYGEFRCNNTAGLMVERGT